jgi:Isochorismatase family
MANPTYEPKITALLCVDFYNDFLSEGGKLWPWVKEIAEQVKLLDNLHTIVRTAREAGITVFHVPHHRMEPDTYKDWKYPAPYQLQAAKSQIFAKGSWGGTFHDDFQVMGLRWCGATPRNRTEDLNVKVSKEATDGVSASRRSNDEIIATQCWRSRAFRPGKPYLSDFCFIIGVDG